MGPPLPSRRLLVVCLGGLFAPRARSASSVAFAVVRPSDAGAFHVGRGSSGRRSGSPSAPSSSSLSSAEVEDALFLERFRRRRDEAASRVEAERSLRPPRPHLAPKDVVTSLLGGLLRPHDPVPYFGYEILRASSTPRWNDVLRKSVGAPEGTEEGLICRALGVAMERRDNQFEILVEAGANGDGDADDATRRRPGGGSYAVEFPWDTLDYYDGTAWVECRLRDGETDELLVVLGWSMERREKDGSWLIDGIDWQDFREKYRPGIGREEWERICG